MARRIRYRNIKRSRNIRRFKIPLLVVSAIKNIRNTKGTTENKIVNYVAKVSDISKSSARRRVDIALRRALNYGVLECKRGYYFLDTDSPFFDDTRTKLNSLRRSRVRAINRNPRAVKKDKKTRRRLREPFFRAVRRPILSSRKKARNTRGTSSPHQLSDMYCNPSYKDSTDSSVASNVSRKSSDLHILSDIVQDEK